MIGREISHYRITELVSSGGMGTVYKADDLTLNRTVAIKAVKPNHQDPEIATKRFLREAQAISKIEHPNVVTLFDVVQEADANFLILQYVPGRSLRQIIMAGEMDPSRAIDVAREIAMGLGAAHDLGVIHRDIKPDNVVVEPSGRCKVLDFGIAHLVDRSTLSGKGRIVGTLPYTAPEQIKGSGVDARTDVYALGIVLFEMIAGKPPFEGPDESALFHQILNSDPPQIDARDDKAAMRASDIVTRALAKKPEDRYQSIAEMLEDLSNEREGRAAGGQSRPAGEKGERRRKQILIWVAAIAVVGIVAVALLAR